MNPSEFMHDFEKEYQVKVIPVIDKKWAGHIFAWKPEIEITGTYPTNIYDLQKLCLKEEITMWVEGNGMFLSEDGFRELVKLIKQDWGVDE